MARLRSNRAFVRAALDAPDWRERIWNLLERMPRGPHGLKSLVGPLMSCLVQGGEPGTRAAAAIGECVARIARDDPEEGRIIMRRFLWHMSDESGNIGWGVPESMAETLARSDLLAREFSHLLLSYIRHTGSEDNFVDYAPLRRSCYQAVGRLIGARPEYAAEAAPLLLAGLGDEDVACRDMAAWALTQARAGYPDDAGGRGAPPEEEQCPSAR